MRKLRSYKGVAFDPAKAVFLYEGFRFGQAVDVIVYARHRACSSSVHTDDDHAEMMRLKAEPYEPAPRLEDVLDDAYAEWFGSSITSLALPQFIANRLRAAFPHIDQEER
jgi:hypothetical protein